MRKTKLFSLFLFIIATGSYSFVLAQENHTKIANPFSIFMEGSTNRFWAGDDHSGYFGGAGLVPSWKFSELKSEWKSDLGIVMPVRYFQTNQDDVLLDSEKYGFSASALFRYNALWNKKKDHTYFFMSFGPEILKEIRKDHSGFLWAFQLDFGLKFNNPDLFFEHTEFGFYSSMALSKSALTDKVAFSGFYFRYSFLQ